jgi:hypothetical protein
VPGIDVLEVWRIDLSALSSDPLKCSYSPCCAWMYFVADLLTLIALQ